MLKSTTEKANEVTRSNGIHNPNGAFIGLVSAAFVLAIPVTSYLTTPDSLIQHLLYLPQQLFPNQFPADRFIALLATFYVFFTYAFTGALSGAVQAMGNPNGLDPNHPRKHLPNLSGLPLRMNSAHNNLMEMLPGWALAAALAQVLAPQDQHILNLLGFHVLIKCFVYYPAYCANLGPGRSLAHLVATGAVLNVGFRLASGTGSSNGIIS